jgi:hypothetical protein
MQIKRQVAAYDYHKAASRAGGNNVAVGWQSDRLEVSCRHQSPNFLLTKSEIVTIHISIDGIDAPGREPGAARPGLFETRLDHNSTREIETEASFPI